VAGLVGLAAYSIFAFFCRNKAEGNEVHPYLAFLPIVRFVHFFSFFISMPPRFGDRDHSEGYPAYRKDLKLSAYGSVRVCLLMKDGGWGVTWLYDMFIIPSL
jgi:hypothetical protein